MQAGTAGAAELQTILPAAGEQQRQAGGRACPSPGQTGARRALPCGFSAMSAGTAEAEAPGAASNDSWNLKRVSVPFTAPAETGACLRRPATDLGAPAGTSALARHPLAACSAYERDLFSLHARRQRMARVNQG